MDTLGAYLRKKFPDRMQSDDAQVSQLVHELKIAGYKTIGEIDKIIDATKNAFEAYESAYGPKASGYAAVGALRLSLRLVSPQMREHYEQKSSTAKQTNERLLTFGHLVNRQ